MKEEAHGAGGACGERVKGVHAEGTALAKARRQHHGFEELKDMQWLKRTVAPAQGGEEDRPDPEGALKAAMMTLSQGPGTTGVI